MLKTKDILDEKDKRVRAKNIDCTLPLSNEEKKLINLYYLLTNGYIYDSKIIETEVSDEICAKVNTSNIPGLTCEYTTKRTYMYDTLNDILGKVGNISKENKEYYLSKGYSLNDQVGLSYLEKEYDAIFIGIGANISRTLNIPGIELKGIYGANELLENNNHPSYKNKKVVVYGGGNVAMDAARTIKKLGAKEVNIVYRRSLKEMPAETFEINEAQQEGINFIYQTNIISIIGNKKIEKIECLKTELIKDDTSERLIPRDIKDSNHTIDTDILVTAIGSKTEQEIVKELDLELDSNNKIII